MPGKKPSAQSTILITAPATITAFFQKVSFIIVIIVTVKDTTASHYDQPSNDLSSTLMTITFSRLATSSVPNSHVR